ncbi:LLM class flavin-dependent oxidoreductase [Kibdelosporangium aridum]|uniref:Luciferase-like monooxygenase n=1 Tax=Kibdelosporangium aridum TaxID=2030 RepID=A0A1Y5XYV3_KIBAR|nr:LLM class flavin-dependent oxidoreductase [Kibdelosporangium aridum]SMD22024.1 Luciferase-like monooxygenase [Kibdelosporangium aridum]
MPDRPRMLFNAFTMFTPSHHTQGMWAEPDSKQLAYNDPETWIELADLGFAFTQNILQEHPYPFARKLSTLDHLTGGRVAWNIVTTFLEGTDRNLGYGGLPDHDDRYARARMSVYLHHVLRTRGLIQSGYSPGTLREKFFPGGGPRLAASHPARRPGPPVGE